MKLEKHIMEAKERRGHQHQMPQNKEDKQRGESRRLSNQQAVGDLRENNAWFIVGRK